MSVTAYGSGAIGLRHANEAFRRLRADMAGLEAQLTTGRIADNHAGLGAGAGASLDARATLSALDGYEANIADASLRTSLIGTGLDGLARLSQGLGTLPARLGANGVGQTSAQTSAADGLALALDILNTEAGGRYLFSGRSADVAPAASFDLVMDGDGVRAGLRQLTAERRAADAGADGLGRLVLSASGATTTLSEEADGLPFGLKLRDAAATGAGLSASLAAGPPQAVTVAVNAQPAAGDTLRLVLGLPDGTEHVVTLTARAAGSAEAAKSFSLGATPDATAANLRAALDDALGTAVATAGAAASGLAAATAFFAGSAGSPPLRVQGSPATTATALAPGSAADTVIWYAGDDAAGSARETAASRVGAGAALAIGARANEAGFRALLAGLGALAADVSTPSDANAASRYSATAARAADLAGPGALDEITTDFALAKAALGSASERLDATRAQVEDALDAVESADPNEVAMQLLATQTRLQASYQATAALARLSLVEFL